MANALTGDFDLVAQFSIAGANRILAAMHSSERFPHSMSLRVDDTPSPGPRLPHFTAVEAVDSFGEPVVNPGQIGHPIPIPGGAISTDPARAALGGVINPDVAGALGGELVPSHIKGIAQLQVFPPSFAVPDASGNKLAVRINLMSHFVPDPNTAPLAKFMRGDLQIVADVTQVASQTANVIEIDFKADDAFIAFMPSFTSKSLSAEDLAGINLCILNALKTSALPSSASLPANVRFMQFKTLLSPQNAIAVLLNLGVARGDAATMHEVFLAGSDDFALAVNADFIRSALQPTIDAILNQPPFSITIPIDVYFTTYHVVYSIALKSVTLDLQNGVVLTVTGDATETSHKWYAPDSFSFTAKLSFSVVTDGTAADLVPGDVSLDTSSWLVNQFRDRAKAGIIQARDQALSQSGAQALVRNLFDVNKNLGDFLNSLLTPAKPIAALSSQKLQLAYTSITVQPEGIVLHGSISVLASRRVAISDMAVGFALPVPSWPRARVEFERMPAAGTQAYPGGTVLQGPDYSALKSWIPGGTIQSYEWSTQSQPQPFATDSNKFVLESSGPANTMAASIAAYSPLCLTVRGSRIAASGPAVAQPVSASVCGFTSVSVLAGGLGLAADEALPLIALARADQYGRIQIAGHVTARPGSQRGTPNVVVHFPDARSAEDLNVLNQALRASGREDAATAILAILGREQLAVARYAESVIVADNSDGAWDTVFKAEQARPQTMIITPEGKRVWAHSGELSGETLVQALRKYLVKCGFGWTCMFRPSARTGHPAPDFLFEYAPGRKVTLRKLAPRDATLVFWRVASAASVEEVRQLQKKVAGQGNVLLAINDGDPADEAKRIAAEYGFQASLVVDPSREISSAYEIEVWPTTVFVNASGLIAGACIGRAHTRDAELSSTQTSGKR